MRQVSPLKLQICVRDLIDSLNVLPKWIESSASDRPGRGHYEWGNWSDALRHTSMWVMGGPWRTLVADVRMARMLSCISDFHKFKDQAVWEVVEQTYLRSESKRQSNADEYIVKTRIRSVFSWQRRHDVKKHSLVWFLDFAFALSAYAEFQACMLFSGSSVPLDDPARLVPLLAPSEFGVHATRMERKMISHGFLPFYCRVDGLSDQNVLLARVLATTFSRNLAPPTVNMDTDVKETRGMPREEKAVDFMSPWLEDLAAELNDARWNTLIASIMEHKDKVESFDILKSEVCRAIVALVLSELAMSDNPEAGYVYDIAASSAVEQREKELLVSLRLVGQKRKRIVSRRTLRCDLDARISRWLQGSTQRVQDEGKSKRRDGDSHHGESSARG